MVRQWQEFFFDKRYASTPITSPDFIKLAEAYGVPAKRVSKHEDVTGALDFAKNTPGPVLIEYIVEKEESVFPMVPTGAALDEMMRRPITNQKEAIGN